MPELKKERSEPNSPVKLLVLAATGAVLFTMVAGALLYFNTRKLIEAAGWVQHTQDVLASLQRVALLTERIDYRTRLYVLTGNEEQLNRARASTNQLNTSVVHIQALVSDNAGQAKNLQSLFACAGQLTETVNNFAPKSEFDETQVQGCQQTIGLMVDQEQSLMIDRNKQSDDSSYTSIETEVAFVAVSLIVLMLLFSFLLRNSLARRRVGDEMALANERLGLSVKALEDRGNESALLTSARDELQLCVEVQQVYVSAAASFSRLLEGTCGSLCMINNSRQLVEVVSSWGGDENAMEDVSGPESCCGLRSGHLRWRLPSMSEIHCMHFAGQPPQRYLCMPVIAHGNTLGVLYVQCADDAVVQSVNQHMDGLRQLVQLTGMAAATLNLRTKLENQSIRDSLTGLFNRHFMQISLERELSRAARRKQILAVFMLDLDHFKKFNDTYGHAAGDKVLKSISEIFQNSIRSEDIACRYGGEEFTIMLPDVTPAIALDRAESIRMAVANLHLTLEHEVYSDFTVSIGVALYPMDGEGGELLLQRADQALYRAKRSGRNQVIQYEEAAVEV